MTYNIENPGPGMRQAHTCGWVKLVNGIATIYYWKMGLNKHYGNNIFLPTAGLFSINWNMVTFSIFQQDAPAHRKSPTEGNDNKNQQGTSQQTPSSQINRPSLMGTPPGLVTRKKTKNLTFNGLSILVLHVD